jgi:para-nitrobenzyl esterase
VNWILSISGMLTALAAFAGPAAAADASAPVARTQAGLVQGQLAADGAVEVFRGIPFAAPPVGELRWQAPRPPAPWSGVRDAVQSASPCPQTGRLASTNEDCLYLNVWAPHQRHGRRLPVMVFLHGGGQVASAPHEYNADWLVTRGTPVVYVSMNYRLNIFAFFAHKALTAEDPQLGSGNYAALDQIQALRWVRDNIAAFGGDPHNVTIFGESGGGQAVCILLASPPARGLFQRAISQSAPCQWQYYPSLAASEDKGAEIASELGCPGPDPMPCLRALPASAVLARQRGPLADTAAAQPAWGGGVFPMPLREAISSGQFAHVPLMQGSNRDEAVFQLAPVYEGAGKPVTAAQYPQLLAKYLGGSRVAGIEQHYPLSRYPTPGQALAAALTDSGMVTNNRIGLCNLLLADRLAAPHVPVYSYEFADPSAPYPAPVFEAPPQLAGAAHTKDLGYLFHQAELTPAQRRISDTMIGYWTHFAATGNPNAKGLPTWPAFSATRPMVLKIEPNGVAADTRLGQRAQCTFWAEQGFATLSGPYPTAGATGPDYR